jgi:2-keto-4-pentenoate hydratase/2-oxohepta-3-ene-1,7-dioic acid hydratase in catechol pathway
MRTVRFRADSGVRTGESTAAGIEYRGRVHDPASLEVLAPVESSRVVGVGLNHPGVLVGTDRYDAPDDPSELLLFLKPATTLVRDGETATLPATGDLQYEAEFGAVIGMRCRNASPAEAADAIAGFTCVNDITAYGVRDMEITGIRAQGIDDSTPVGPVVAPVEDVPADASIQLRVNGEEVRSARRSEYRFTAGEVVAEVTKYMTLLPGDVVSLGTSEGYGNPEDGDTVAVEIEGVGTLTTAVSVDRAEQARYSE